MSLWLLPLAVAVVSWVLFATEEIGNPNPIPIPNPNPSPNPNPNLTLTLTLTLQP